MPKLYADNAAMAKARALYGKRLHEEDYRQLLSKKSVGEVAAYLKQETYYSSLLAEVKEDLIHRGQLENLLHMHTLNIYIKLARYSMRGDVSTMLYVSENEIAQLLIMIRMLNTGTMKNYIVSFPAYLSRRLSFDLFSAARIKNYDDLLALVAHSPYYAILGRYRPISAERRIDIAGVETALLTHHYTTAINQVQKNYHGGARADLLYMLLMQIDLHNLQIIYRMKHYWDSPPDAISNCLLHIPSHISKERYRSLLEAKTAPAVLEQLSGASLFRRYVEDSGQSIEHITGTLNKKYSQKLFRFSVKPAVAVMCYMTLHRVEISNIIHITEGIRYAMPPNEIRKLLL